MLSWGKTKGKRRKIAETWLSDKDDYVLLTGDTDFWVFRCDFLKPFAAYDDFACSGDRLYSFLLKAGLVCLVEAPSRGGEGGKLFGCSFFQRFGPC